MKIKVKAIASHIPREIKEIAEKFNSAGFSLYVVGGSLRNIFLKKEKSLIGDFDLATEASPAEIDNLFSGSIPTGIKFGTVTIRYEDKQYETTTFRKDGRYLDGRHPAEVNFTKNLQEDLARRDFTVNALAYDPLTLEIVDLFGGLEDLKNKIIRCVGNPVERFREDGLRVMRACRLAAQLGFTLEPETFNGIIQALDVFKMVSPERIREELIKILKTPKPSVAFELMRETHILDIILPELLEGFGL
jgi:tRNA nucleotidyltransferase/poly(A) polymerase